jgi:hypothetical protein
LPGHATVSFATKNPAEHAGPGSIPSGLFSDFFYVAASRPAQMTTEQVFHIARKSGGKARFLSGRGESCLNPKRHLNPVVGLLSPPPHAFNEIDHIPAGKLPASSYADLCHPNARAGGLI